MADIMSRATRSALMSRIRSRNTRPERALRSALRRAGVRFRSYHRIRGVRVDFALPDLRVALLVHGCFWHGCPRHYTAPASNAVFWKRKLADNRSRDRRQLRMLRAAGWLPVVVWEHSLRAGPWRVVARGPRGSG
jgi:DNA mismatch endonuclease (patch repair protein)